MTDIVEFYKTLSDIVNNTVGASSPKSSSSGGGAKAKKPSSGPGYGAPKPPEEKDGKASSGQDNDPSKELPRGGPPSGDWRNITDAELGTYIDDVQVGLAGTQSVVKDYLKIVAFLVKTEFSGIRPSISSGYRSPRRQSEVMMENWRGHGGNTPLSRPQQSRHGVEISTRGEAYIHNLYGRATSIKFCRLMLANDDAAALREMTAHYEENPGNGSHISGNALDFRSRGMASPMAQLLERTKVFADVFVKPELEEPNPHYHVVVRSVREPAPPALSSRKFPLIIKKSYQISVEPYNTIINSVLAKIKAKLGESYFSYTNEAGQQINVTKIVLEDGDPGHFGMVRSNEPSTIYLSLAKIQNSVAGAANEDALEQAIIETLTHEMGHLKDNLKGGEGPAEAEANRVKGLFSSQKLFALKLASELEHKGLFNEAALVKKTVGIKTAILDTTFNANDLSQSLLRIIYHFVQKVKPENQSKYVKGLAQKVQQMDLPHLALRKKNPGGGVGQMMSLLKNILAGLDPHIITETIRLTYNGLTVLA